MGRARRVIQRGLPEKLLRIRLTPGESQERIAKLLDYSEAPGRNTSAASGLEL